MSKFKITEFPNRIIGPKFLLDEIVHSPSRTVLKRIGGYDTRAEAVAAQTKSHPAPRSPQTSRKLCQCGGALVRRSDPRARWTECLDCGAQSSRTLQKLGT